MKTQLSSMVERLRTYCLAKPGTLRRTYFGGEQSFYLLHHQEYFVFYLEEELIRVLLRCKLTELDDLQHQLLLQVSSKRHSDSPEWKWVELHIYETTPEALVFHLLDSSWQICMAELQADERKFIDIVQASLPLAESLHALIDHHQLQHRRSEIEALISPAILLRTHAMDEEHIALGQSKIGGVPDLPDDMLYPVFGEEPLAFLAQINLGDIRQSVQRSPLPTSGILYFFSAVAWQSAGGERPEDLPWVEGDEPGSSQVLYLKDATTPLHRHPKPRQIKTFETATVTLVEVPVLPRARKSGFRTSPQDHEQDPVLDDFKWDQSEFARLDDLSASLRLLLDLQLGHKPQHQLLGYANVIQTRVTQPDTRLLLQIDSDHHDWDTDMIWDDGGMIYFTIPKAQLEAQDFSQCKSKLQSF